jgi:hypothetical protein
MRDTNDSLTDGDDEYLLRLEAVEYQSPAYRELLREAARKHAISRNPYWQAVQAHQRPQPDLLPRYEDMRPRS